MLAQYSAEPEGIHIDLLIPPRLIKIDTFRKTKQFVSITKGKRIFLI